MWLRTSRTGEGPELLLECRGGARMLLPADLAIATSYIALEQEDWFEDEIRFVRRFLRPGMRAMDVGANFGFYTLAMAGAVGAQGRVWSFEPASRTARFLAASMAQNGLDATAMLQELALSDRPGELAFESGAHPETSAVADSGTTRVRATTFDRFWAERGEGELDFIKLDVEGHESAALAGGTRLLAGNSPLVMMEIKAGHEHSLAAAGRLQEAGYRLYRLLPGALFLVPLEPAQAPDQYLLNAFACKADRAAELARAGLLADGPDPRVEEEAASLTPDGLLEFDRFADERRGAAERWGWLLESLGTWTRAREEGDTLFALCGYARAAWEAGRRSDAVAALLQAWGRLDGEAGELAQREHLAPAPQASGLGASAPGDPAAVLRCAIVEQLERLRGYSSYYTDETALTILDPIRERPERSPETDRRLQLVRMKLGAQAGPEPWPLLAERSEGNLNPGFWRGEAID